MITMLTGSGANYPWCRVPFSPPISGNVCLMIGIWSRSSLWTPTKLIGLSTILTWPSADTKDYICQTYIWKSADTKVRLNIVISRNQYFLRSREYSLWQRDVY